MATVRSDDRAPSPPNGGRLESWKEIAAYLKRGERTVRRWEEQEDLPVHRHQHAKRGSVFAFTDELDAWRDSRQPDVDEPQDERSPWGSRPESHRSLKWLTVAGGAIALSLVGTWAVGRPEPAPPVARTPNPEAVRVLQQGRFGGDPGRTQVNTGIKYAREAIRIDPDYADAWTNLGIGHVALTWYGESRSVDTMNEARKAAERALHLNPASGRPSLVFGWVSHYVEWDHQAAERHFRRALELHPGALSQSWFGDFLVSLGRLDEALRSYRAAQQAAPRWLEPIVAAAHLHTIRGHFDLASAEFARALEVTPTHGLANHFYGRMFLERGDFPRAIAQFRKSNDLLGHVPFSTADLGYALAVGGHRAEAERLLADLQVRRQEGYYPAFALAIIELGLGRTDDALDWLDRAADERHMGYYFPSADPVYDDVRSHPRFVALLRRLHLTPS
jgi:tetratricopeptide (TPR) repeat protein